ncbi:hypothetical protein [Cecembia calidifontis]|uniref:Sporulation related protein n=1 Tax=Cecembia calidifontis TaxID=1187080 RepID=A0A4Q7P9Q3_9BACT|nr:hypothetical protein [Cecembia calidifontis]RZS95472.1 hypothetical protein BC751_1004 [Cecembia calidifontis]
MKRSLLGSFVLVFVLGSCATVKKTGSGAEAFANYREDLSETLITFPDLAEQANKQDASASGESQLAVDADLKIALEKFRNGNRSERTWNGFTVLVYSGVDRDLAFKTRNDIYSAFPEMKVDMQYQQPRYLVKVGKFINRIEAQEYYHQLKAQFPTSRIIQDRFQREGYVNPDPIQDGER